MEKLNPVNNNQNYSYNKNTEDAFSYFETKFNSHAAYKCRKLDKDNLPTTITSEIGDSFYVKSAFVFMDKAKKKDVLTYALDKTMMSMVERGCTKDQIEKNPLIMGFLKKFFNVA